MINNTKKESDLKKLGIECTPFIRVMGDVFGNNPNKENLKQFFRNEVI